MCEVTGFKNGNKISYWLGGRHREVWDHQGVSWLGLGKCWVQGITLQGKEPWAKYFEEPQVGLTQFQALGIPNGDTLFGHIRVLRTPRSHQWIQASPRGGARIGG